MTGDTAAVAVAVDRVSGRRFVLDCEVIGSPTPQKIRDLIFRWTDEFRPQTWIIESNAFQLFLTQDEEITKFLAVRGCVLRPHYTSRVNKWDDSFGVASMAPLFGYATRGEHENRILVHDGNNTIEFPHANPGIKVLMEQLVAWSPNTKNKTDAVMALWFCHLVASEVVSQADTSMTWYGRNPYASPRDVQNRQVIDLSDWNDSRLNGAGLVRGA
jgi:hypothetical protein